jgi:hypothetical protein
MFITELRKYSGEFPLVELFEDISFDAFILLLEDPPIHELKHIAKLVPANRHDILSIISNVIGLQTNVLIS